MGGVPAGRYGDAYVSNQFRGLQQFLMTGGRGGTTRPDGRAVPAGGHQEAGPGVHHRGGGRAAAGAHGPGFARRDAAIIAVFVVTWIWLSELAGSVTAPAAASAVTSTCSGWRSPSPARAADRGS